MVAAGAMVTCGDALRARVTCYVSQGFRWQAGVVGECDEVGDDCCR